MELKTQKINIEEIDQIVNGIIQTINVGAASRLLKDLRDLDSESKMKLGRRLEEIKTKLMLVNFPGISEKDAARIIRENLLLFFKNNIPLEQRLLSRYAFWGTTEKNNQRRIIKQAILENKEKIGSYTISEWIKKVDSKTEDEASEEKNAINLFTNDNDFHTLSELEKSILKSVLHTYINFIKSELIDIFDASIILKKQKNITTNSRRDFSTIGNSGDMQNKAAPQPGKIVNIPIREAMDKFPRIMNQQITSEKITLKKDSSQLVFPTIKNWLANYTYTLGFEKHSSIERSDFLFRSINVRNLSNSERNNLSTLLRSFDENSPIKIDKENQKIVFSNFQQSPSLVINNQPTDELPQEEFTFHQRMSFEEKNKAVSIPENKKLPIQKIKSSTIDIPSQKKIITNPAEKRIEEKKNQKNLIDLKDFN